MENNDDDGYGENDISDCNERNYGIDEYEGRCFESKSVANMKSYQFYKILNQKPSPPSSRDGDTIGSERVVWKKVFSCPVCQRHFISTDFLQGHINRRHAEGSIVVDESMGKYVDATNIKRPRGLTDEPRSNHFEAEERNVVKEQRIVNKSETMVDSLRTRMYELNEENAYLRARLNAAELSIPPAMTSSTVATAAVAGAEAASAEATWTDAHFNDVGVANVDDQRKNKRPSPQWDEQEWQNMEQELQDFDFGGDDGQRDEETSARPFVEFPDLREGGGGGGGNSWGGAYFDLNSHGGGVKGSGVEEVSGGAERSADPSVTSDAVSLGAAPTDREDVAAHAEDGAQNGRRPKTTKQDGRGGGGKGGDKREDARTHESNPPHPRTNGDRQQLQTTNVGVDPNQPHRKKDCPLRGFGNKKGEGRGGGAGEGGGGGNGNTPKDGPNELRMTDDHLPVYPHWIPWSERKRRPQPFFNWCEAYRRRLDRRFHREMVAKLSPHQPEPVAWDTIVDEASSDEGGDESTLRKEEEEKEEKREEKEGKKKKKEEKEEEKRKDVEEELEKEVSVEEWKVPRTHKHHHTRTESTIPAPQPPDQPPASADKLQQERQRQEQQARRDREEQLQRRQREKELEEEEERKKKVRYPDVPVIEDDDDDEFDSEEEKDTRKHDELTGHSNNGVFQGMPYISQPLPDPQGAFDVSSNWNDGDADGGWNSNWNSVVEDPELYWGMGVVFDPVKSRGDCCAWTHAREHLSEIANENALLPARTSERGKSKGMRGETKGRRGAGRGGGKRGGGEGGGGEKRGGGEGGGSGRASLGADHNVSKVKSLISRVSTAMKTPATMRPHATKGNKGWADSKRGRWADHARGRWVDGARGRWADGAGGRWADDARGRWADGAEGGWADGAKGGWADGAEGGWADGAEGGWADGAGGGWADGAEGGWADGADNGSFRNARSSKSLIRKHFPTKLDSLYEDAADVVDT